jgi:hypothetical protein
MVEGKGIVSHLAYNEKSRPGWSIPGFDVWRIYEDFDFTAPSSAGQKYPVDGDEVLCLLVASGKIFGRSTGFVLVLRKVTGILNSHRFERIGIFHHDVKPFEDQNEIALEIQ